jgi:hypothetical protein
LVVELRPNTLRRLKGANLNLGLHFEAQISRPLVLIDRLGRFSRLGHLLSHHNDVNKKIPEAKYGSSINKQRASLGGKLWTTDHLYLDAGSELWVLT